VSLRAAITRERSNTFWLICTSVLQIILLEIFYTASCVNMRIKVEIAIARMNFLPLNLNSSVSRSRKKLNNKYFIYCYPSLLLIIEHYNGLPIPDLTYALVNLWSSFAKSRKKSKHHIAFNYLSFQAQDLYIGKKHKLFFNYRI